MNVVKEGFLDVDRAGIGGVVATSRVAMIGSVLLVGNDGSDGSDNAVGVRLCIGDLEPFILDSTAVVVTIDAGLCDCE